MASRKWWFQGIFGGNWKSIGVSSQVKWRSKNIGVGVKFVEAFEYKLDEGIGGLNQIAQNPYWWGSVFVYNWGDKSTIGGCNRFGFHDSKNS